MPLPSIPTRMRLLCAVLLLAVLACQASEPTASPAPLPNPTGQASAVFDLERTLHGFFPAPPEDTTEAVLAHFQNLGEHADFILVQPNVPWEDFQAGVEGDSEPRTNLRNQVMLAGQNGLGWVFVLDPLNGLNRREFFGLPADWEPSFADPEVRAAFSNFALWIVREFSPSFLGLASEINTYFDAHPDEVEHFLSLYAEVYDRVKAEAPKTQIFVTFQWDDLNNMIAQAAEGRPAGQTNWEQVEAFEPRLDLWVISSYPYFVFPKGASIPADYYLPLLSRTSKPLAVAEGGWASRPVGPIHGDEAAQSAYLEAIHDQLGERLRFWVYLILTDFDIDKYGQIMRQQGRPDSDIQTLGFFATVGLTHHDGRPKPALALWDAYRGD